MTDIRTELNHVQFETRACGILQIDDRILVSNKADGSMTLIGGAVKIGETTEQAVVREFLEETGLIITRTELVAIIENFFALNSQNYQQIVFVYGVSLAEKSEQLGHCKEGADIRWRDVADIKSIKPEIINRLIKTKKHELQHYISFQ
ncbi:NUDIX hydrolase [Lapidilactobacillus bayanensis]|uniref:NUDIX hydrolase n=1 Tax=Lapidilactobacillus bayanensis TaxID=2485998 RepID=UPI001CDB81B6|nr:NUDIX domain-containing protein [Lapidilactobacillus bayanensis]